MEIADLRAALVAAQAEATTETLLPEEAEHAKLLAQLEAAKATTFAARKARRAIAGAKAEAEARAAARGQFLVKFLDLGTMLLEADPKTLPGEGVIVIRSPPTTPVDVLGTFATEYEARQRHLPDLVLDLFLSSIVYPSTDGAEGIKLRVFFEGPIGKGAAQTCGGEVQALGGLKRREAKRGSE